MSKRHSDLNSLMKSVSQNTRVREETQKELKKRQLANFLVFLRCDNCLTQKEMAKKMGCTQSKISKLEMSYDDQISVKDLLEYGKVLNLQLELGYRNKNVKITELINYHICRIREYLTKLVFISKGDNAMSTGAIKVCESTLNKFIEIVGENISIIRNVNKKTLKEDSDEIHISVPLKEKREMQKA